MKKILVLMVAILALCSCNSGGFANKTIERTDTSSVITLKSGVSMTVYPFKYKDHDYLMFGRDRGVVHDPDCDYCFSVFD